MAKLTQAQKYSILIQYNRIFPQKAFRITTYTLLVLILIQTLWAFFSSILVCMPVQRFWDPHVHGGCIALKPLWYANAGWNALTDVVIAVLPLPIFHKLQVPAKQRMGLMCVFALGGL